MKTSILTHLLAIHRARRALRRVYSLFDGTRTNSQDLPKYAKMYEDVVSFELRHGFSEGKTDNFANTTTRTNPWSKTKQSRGMMLALAAFVNFCLVYHVKYWQLPFCTTTVLEHVSHQIGFKGQHVTWDDLLGGSYRCPDFISVLKERTD